MLELTKRYKREYQQPIKVKVVNILKHWINGYFKDDFAQDSELLALLHKFIDKIGRENKSFQSVLVKVLQKKMQAENKSLDDETASVVLSIESDDAAGVGHLPMVMFKSTTSNSSTGRCFRILILIQNLDITNLYY